MWGTDNEQIEKIRRGLFYDRGNYISCVLSSGDHVYLLADQGGDRGEYNAERREQYGEGGIVLRLCS